MTVVVVVMNIIVQPHLLKLLLQNLYRNQWAAPTITYHADPKTSVSEANSYVTAELIVVTCQTKQIVVSILFFYFYMHDFHGNHFRGKLISEPELAFRTLIYDYWTLFKIRHSL